MHSVTLIVRRFAIGIIASIVAVLIGLIIELMWGRIYGEYGWQYVSIAILVFAVMAVAGAEEMFRPPNPYKHLDPRFGLQDAAPSGKIYSSSSSLLWNLVPIAFTIATLILSIG